MKNIAICGAGGFGREVQMLIEQINNQRDTWHLVGFYDDGYEIGSTINGASVIGGIDDLSVLENETFLVFAIGNPLTKEKLYSKINNENIKYATLIHPNVQIGQRNKIGNGVIITAGNVITVNTKIGDHVILNLSCTVGHDTVIGDFCSFMPGINISGEVIIARSVFIGTGVKIINQVVIGANSIIGAGAVVTKTIPENCTAVGTPAKPIKFHD